MADLDGFFVACDGLFGLEHVLVRVPHVANTTHTHSADEDIRNKLEVLCVSIFYYTQVQVQIY